MVSGTLCAQPLPSTAALAEQPASQPASWPACLPACPGWLLVQGGGRGEGVGGESLCNNCFIVSVVFSFGWFLMISIKFPTNLIASS